VHSIRHCSNQHKTPAAQQSPLFIPTQNARCTAVVTVQTNTKSTLHSSRHCSNQHKTHAAQQSPLLKPTQNASCTAVADSPNQNCTAVASVQTNTKRKLHSSRKCSNQHKTHAAQQSPTDQNNTKNTQKITSTLLKPTQNALCTGLSSVKTKTKRKVNSIRHCSNQHKTHAAQQAPAVKPTKNARFTAFATLQSNKNTRCRAVADCTIQKKHGSQHLPLFKPTPNTRCTAVAECSNQKKGTVHSICHSSNQLKTHGTQ
jgi:hypothetical protein